MHVVATLIVVLLVVTPFVVQLWVQRLPEAPQCPCCRATTRHSHVAGDLARLLPVLAATSRSECTHCGWRGRMRWRWAARSVRSD